MCTSSQSRQRGFTLVEAIVVILIAAILATGIISYIGDSVEGMSAASNRNKLATSARTVLDRMALELHNAVPNSVRVTEPDVDGNQCLEFIPFIRGTAYLAAPMTGQGGDRARVVEFNPVLRFDEHDPLDPPPAGMSLYAVIYPNNTNQLYAYNENLPVGPPGGPVSRIAYIRDSHDLDVLDELDAEEFDTCADEELVIPPSGIGEPDFIRDGQATVCFANNHRFRTHSAARRMFVAQQPVSFCVVDDRIYRYSGYGFRAVQCTPDDVDCLPETAAEGRHLITDRVDNRNLDGPEPLTAFTVLPPTLRRNAIISMEINLTSQGDNVQMVHEVLLRSVP